MNKRTTYDFIDRDHVILYLLPVLLIPVFFHLSASMVFKIAACYTVIALFLFRFSYRAIRVTGSSVIVINNLKPFRKIRRYALTDVSVVGIGSYKMAWRIAFYFKDKKQFSAGLHYNLEEICKFFLDKGITVNTGNEELRYFMTHYRNDPKANLIRRQIRSAKRRNLTNIPS